MSSFRKCTPWIVIAAMLTNTVAPAFAGDTIVYGDPYRSEVQERVTLLEYLQKEAGEATETVKSATGPTREKAGKLLERTGDRISRLRDQVQADVKRLDPRRDGDLIERASRPLKDTRFLTGAAGAGLAAWGATALLSAMAPGAGLFARALVGVGAGSLGWEIGSGKTADGRTDWTHLLVTSLGSAGGAAALAAVLPGLGMIGCALGGVAGFALAGWALNWLRSKGANPTMIAQDAKNSMVRTFDRITGGTTNRASTQDWGRDQWNTSANAYSAPAQANANRDRSYRQTLDAIRGNDRARLETLHRGYTNQDRTLQSQRRSAFGSR